jgi:hypothetical protein
MSRVLYDFLTESFLFREDYLNDNFASFDLHELEAELQRYREHVLASLDDIEAETNARDTLLSIFFDTVVRSQPSIDRLKQCAFYFDFVVVDDPLFALSKRPDPAAKAPTEMLGYQQPRAGRDEIASAARFMQSLAPMVGADFLKLSPVSFYHEPTEGIPYRVSANLFFESVPSELHPFFQERVRVHSMWQTEGGTWAYRPGQPLTPSRAIHVEFDGLERGYAYYLFATKVLSVEEGTRTVTTVNTLPDTPPSLEEFAVWVTQSINQSSGNVLRTILTDLTRASFSGSLVCTDSTLVSELMSSHGANTNLETDLANLALQFQVPTLSRATTADLMDARVNHGEAFRNFRVALERELRALRHIEDPEERGRKLEEVRHEFEMVQLNQVRTEIERIKRNLIGEGIAGAASMSAVLYNPQATILGFLAAAVAAAAAKTSLNYFNQIRTHPAYFLWRVNRRG